VFVTQRLFSPSLICLQSVQLHLGKIQPNLNDCLAIGKRPSLRKVGPSGRQKVLLHRPLMTDCWSRESLQKGKDQYGIPPCTNQYRSAAFYNETVFLIFTKQTILIRRPTVLNLPFQLGFLGWFNRDILAQNGFRPRLNHRPC
jgi:hypothetical protein